MRTIQFIQQNNKKPTKYDEYDQSQQNQKILFTQREIQLINKRFNRIAKNNALDYDGFRLSLGILGVSHASFLCDRLFKVIVDGPVIRFDDYLSFLNVLINGNRYQKAQMSFKFLDHQNRGKLISADFNKLCSDVLIFWHYLTGTKILPDWSKIQQLIQALDSNNTGEITFQNYLQEYDNITDILDWQQFFNEKQEESILKPQESQQLRHTLDYLEEQIYGCMIKLKQQSKMSPLCISLPFEKKEGDVSPENEEGMSVRLKQFPIRLEFLEEQFIELADLVKPKEKAKPTKMQTRYKSHDVRRATVANLHKKKQPIYFGHENFDLILNMMIGMRGAVRSLQPIEIELRESDFKSKYIHDIITQRCSTFGKAYNFTDYAPQVFEQIRQKFKITKSMYLCSVGPEKLLGNLILGKLSSLSELSSSGKSGSFFYFTDDSKYMIKTISKNEFELMRSILQQYYQHIAEHPNSLLSRILGLHRMRKGKGDKIYIIVMANLFESSQTIDVRYDLKGSTYGRQTRKADTFIDKNTALKDLDFLEDKIKIQINNKEQLIRDIRNDVIFLSGNNIIDYSLLIGIHHKRLFSQATTEGLLSQDNKSIYFMGIIDILTGYNLAKQLEFSMKSTFVDSNVSCVPPREYGERFINFIMNQCFL